MLPNISAERIFAAMEVYDRDERPTHHWEEVGATQGSYKYRLLSSTKSLVSCEAAHSARNQR